MRGCDTIALTERRRRRATPPENRRNRVNSSTPPEPVTTAADEPRTRRQLLTAGGLAAIAGILGAVGLSTPVAARDGDAIRAGRKTAGQADHQDHRPQGRGVRRQQLRRRQCLRATRGGHLQQGQGRDRCRLGQEGQDGRGTGRERLSRWHRRPVHGRTRWHRGRGPIARPQGRWPCAPRDASTSPVAPAPARRPEDRNS